jgi:hypothetical protein
MNKKNLDKKNEKDKYKTKRKFAFRNISAPWKIFSKISKSLKKKNAYKSPYFWLTNFAFIFIVIKGIQLSKYLNQFTLTIPKEQAREQLLYIDRHTLKNMKPEVLNEYLDQLELRKKERMKNMGNNFGNK